MKVPIVISFLVLLATSGCTNSSPEPSAPGGTAAKAEAPAGKDLGVGPVTTPLVLEAAIKEDLAKKGESIFQAKCSACHKVEERYVGPALKGVTERREPEWIMNMILNPQGMLDKNATAKELLGEYMVPMTFQNLTQDEARTILEYFRKIDKK